MHTFRSDYMQLVFSALPRFRGYFKTLPPCIWKPEMLWSGKQVVSTVLLNIIPQEQDKLNLYSRTKIASKVISLPSPHTHTHTHTHTQSAQ